MLRTVSQEELVSSLSSSHSHVTSNTEYSLLMLLYIMDSWLYQLRVYCLCSPDYYIALCRNCRSYLAMEVKCKMYGVVRHLVYMCVYYYMGCVLL